MENKLLISLTDVSKSFPGVKALDKVKLDVKCGEVHALIGENGAGKSTLMKILTGVIKKDEGTIVYKNQIIDIKNPLEAQELGISIIYQEFNLMPHLTVAQNIFIGKEPRKIIPFILDDNLMVQKVRDILSSLNLNNIHPNDRVVDLSVAQQQMVEIAKAVSFNSDLLIMDEPTSALTKNEINELFLIIARLKERGVGIVYISHRLEELDLIADRVTVMRDGKYIRTMDYQNTNIDEIVHLMVGRNVTERFPERKSLIGDNVLQVKNLNRKGVLFDINLSLNKGEILGVAGLMGAGRTELARAVFGADQIDSGDIYLNGHLVKISTPANAIKNGIGYLSEDRKKYGLALELSVKDNTIMASIPEFQNRLTFLNEKRILSVVQRYIRELSVKTPSINQKAVNLSGGNQQKIIIARWLATNTDILIFDEPTRGIDVGAKYEIYELMNELVAGGKSIILISSELPEILGMCDRVVVMYEGRITGVLLRSEVTQERIMNFATGRN